MKDAILIAGLGNPGKKYENTRHNIGFRAVDKFAEENHFPEFQSSKKFGVLISEKNRSKKVILAKPQTFMNNSGKAIKVLVKYYKIKSENLWIIHDDIDLPLGKIRISQGRGSAGHKGVESIIRELNTKDFWRLRIGIQPKTGKPSQILQNKTWVGKPKNVEKFVLQKFTKEEEQIVKKVIKEAIREIESKNEKS